jgi:hypothetical protein
LPASQSIKAGRTVPLKFSLRVNPDVNSQTPFLYNENLEIRIYKSDEPSVILQTSHFGRGSESYRIDSSGKQYITNFKTLDTPATYVVEIRLAGKDFVIGSFTFDTVK